MNKETWLEFGFLRDGRYEDVLWYNEGRTNIGEWLYFFKHLVKNIFTKDRYFKARLFGKSFYLKGGRRWEDQNI